jgi:valyl-tRNA synthetase
MRMPFNIAVETSAIYIARFLHDNLKRQRPALQTRSHGKEKLLSAQYTLYEVLYRILQLLAPVIPHLTEEIYQYMYIEKGFASLQVSSWPKFNPSLVDEAAEKNGDLIIAVMSEVRRDKAERKLPLNSPIKNLTIYAGNADTANGILQGYTDIAATLKIENIKVLPKTQLEGRQVGQYEVRIQIEY